MADERVPSSILDSFLFPNIFRSFRMAIQPSKLAIAFAAVATVYLTGRIMDLHPTVIVTHGGQYLHRTTADPGSGYTELDAYLDSEARLQALLQTSHSDDAQAGVFAILWRVAAVQCNTALAAVLGFDRAQLAASFFRCARSLTWAFKYHTIYSIIFFAVILMVMSTAGGAICRMTALQFAQGKKPGLTIAARFSRRKLASFVAAPLCPLVVAILLGIPIILLGLIGNIPVVGELLAGVLLPLGLIAAPFIVIVLIGGVAGLSLMTPAIAYEDSDFFDAVSRSFSSVYARPWRLGFYSVVALVYGAVCYVFVRFFAVLLLSNTHWFLRLGMDNEKLQAIWPSEIAAALLAASAMPAPTAPDAWSLWFAALLIRIWVLAIMGLTVAFLISFYYSASTIIYALMRQRVDGTPLDEVYDAPDETTPEPQASLSTADRRPDPDAAQAGGTSE